MKVITQPQIHFQSHYYISLGFEPIKINRPFPLKTNSRSLVVSNCLNTSLNVNHDIQEIQILKYLEFKHENRETCGLPIVIKYSGNTSWCFCDGNEFKFVPIGRDGSFSWWDSSLKSEDRLKKFGEDCFDAAKKFFLPVAFRNNYLDYVKWKFLHRVFSSALQVLATQAMFRAIGIGYSRSLPSAAALNWVLKDGLGRVSRCIYTATFASAFDANLKRLRFSTSVMFSLSIGVELLTPIFPKYFLFLATVANIAKQISLACYLATSSAVHRSFAVADNLGEVSAKAQIQTVCFDNVGLLLAATLNSVFRNNQRLLGALPFVVYPFFSAFDLFGIYQSLKHVHLRTLTKDTLESIINIWIEQEYVSSPAEVSKIEDISLFWSKGGELLPIRIGCLNPIRKLLKLPLMSLKFLKEDFYFICLECLNDRSTVKKSGILLSLREGATTEYIVSGLVQACYIRKRLLMETLYWEMELEACEPSGSGAEKWMVLMKESKQFADDSLRPLMNKMQALGWACGNILLSREELAGYSFFSGV